MNWRISEDKQKIMKLKKAARKMGYLKDQSGIYNRYLNEEGAWQPHLDNCKKYIKQVSQKVFSNRNIAVLGSGWLLDVPIDYLSKTFENVILVDIFHPKQIERRIKKYKNVFLSTEDLTGDGIRQIYENRRSIKHNGLEWLNNLKLKDHFFYNEFDFVISLNILNQLDILMVDYLKSKFRFDQKDLAFLRKLIQQNHL